MSSYYFVCCCGKRVEVNNDNIYCSKCNLGINLDLHRFRIKKIQECDK